MGGGWVRYNVVDVPHQNGLSSLLRLILLNQFSIHLDFF